MRFYTRYKRANGKPYYYVGEFHRYHHDTDNGLWVQIERTGSMLSCHYNSLDAATQAKLPPPPPHTPANLNE